MVSQRTRTIIALVITAVWAVGIVIDALSASFELPAAVSAIEFGVAAAIFGTTFTKPKGMP